MRAFLEAASGFPTLLFTAALVVAVGFWVLVAFGAAGSDSFDAEADLDAWGMGGVPVAVAFSLLTVLAWFLSLGAAILLDAYVPSGILGGLLRLVVPIGVLLAAWRLTCLFVRPLHRLCPDEPEPPRRTEVTEARVGDGATSPHAAPDVEEPVRPMPRAAVLDPRDRADALSPRDRAA
ncbi:hypothetical protein [Streptomyces ureilyticus]|uniref:DUF4328 domain-containing protein n=1 Tax=Streptomyces ureilyticus TaxID=1775131 RepID=A0ABX0DNQ9_9ACTN|nr:hypothetical protein [Streptomyces ureilyticus]NGO43491.1 hypothetical protein [Streptomyces ureilyticus]